MAENEYACIYFGERIYEQTSASGFARIGTRNEPFFLLQYSTVVFLFGCAHWVIACAHKRCELVYETAPLLIQTVSSSKIFLSNTYCKQVVPFLL